MCQVTLIGSCGLLRALFKNPGGFLVLTWFNSTVLYCGTLCLSYKLGNFLL